MNKTISSLVQSQFPQFVRDDYPTLVAFIQAYYQYLEQQKQPQDVLTNLLAYRDIDRTLDEFVSKFETEYIDGLPQNVVGDKRRFIKHVTDLYNTKGTEESYRLLFRLLFGEEIELYYPKQQMLVASGGTWSQRNSIQVVLDPGIDPNCVNKTVKIATQSGVINTYITDVLVLNAAERLYELFVNKNFVILPEAGDRITGKGLAGTIQATAVNADILSGGAGFHVGQVFEINSVLGKGAKVKVTSVDSNGAIKRLAFIQFGTNYEANFQVALDPNVRTSGAINPYASYTNGFVESVLVTKVTYFSSDYCDITYSGQIIGSSYTNDYRPDNALDPSVTPAVVQFELGALCPYRGEYTSASGFLSDVNVIQDGYQYQDFSYVIKTKQKLDDFKAIVKNLIHPAGTAMFSEMDLTSDMDVSASYDYAKVLSAALKFFETLTPTDAIKFITGKALTDSSTPVDSISKKTTKPLTDTQSTSDSVAKKTTKNLTETQTTSDTVTKKTTKALTDASTPVDAVTKSTVKTRSDSVTPSEAIALNTTKSITGDSVTPTDASPSALLIDYCDYHYLAQNYVGTVLM